MLRGVTPTLSAAQARRLFLDAQCLCSDPARTANARAVAELVGRLGFVQVDSIVRVERAHHLTLGARLDGYRPALLDAVAFGKRALFEHWTHDASLIPIALYPHWKPRFARWGALARKKRWYRERMGARPNQTIARVHERVAREGPLGARDFERRCRPATGWWDWTPEKMALEYLWRTGQLAISGRDRFHKRYDLAERVYPEAHASPEPSKAEHLDWACVSALERLGAATPTELSRYWGAISVAQAAAWCRKAVSAGRIVALQVEGVNGAKPRAAYALPDWRERVRAAPEPPDRTRLLSPFDPVVRDRDRLQRLFGFDYRFEAFVPAPERKYGYYVLPILEGERFVGRLDARTDRERGALEVEKLFWEPGARVTRARRKGLRLALENLAKRVGVADVRGVE
jgi:uncharacterized protein YcaQ